MMSKEYFPVLWAICIASLVTPAYSDVIGYVFGLGDNYIPEPLQFIIVAILFITIIMFGAVGFFAFIDSSDFDEDFFMTALGPNKYNIMWSFVILPAVVYGLCKEVYVYAVPLFLCFLVVERLRTLQNRWVHSRYLVQVAKNLREQKNPKEKVILE